MRRLVPVLILILGSFFVGGCLHGPKEEPVYRNEIEKYAGTWDGSDSKSTYKLTIKSEGGFDLQMGSSGQMIMVNGRAELNGDTITLTPRFINGEEPKDASDSQPEIVKVEDGGKKLKPENGPYCIKQY